jgi:AraC-like DNA-binding protein
MEGTRHCNERSMDAKHIARLEHHTAPALHELAPPANLSSFVDRFWQASVPENGPFHEFVIIPDGCVDVVYEQTGSQVRCLIFGTYSQTRPFRINPQATYVGMRFRPGMARHLLDLSPGELTDRHLEMPSFLGLEPEQVTEAATFSAQSELLARVVTSALSHQNAAPTPLDRAIEYVQQTRSMWHVTGLADLCGISQRQMERRVKTVTGLSPKLLMRILRVQAAISTMQTAPETRLIELAGDLGYSDQAHMNRDFRLLTGQTPFEYRTALIKHAR